MQKAVMQVSYMHTEQTDTFQLFVEIGTIVNLYSAMQSRRATHDQNNIIIMEC